MYEAKCPHCQGTGVTRFRQNGGRCYTCNGHGRVCPADILREYRRGDYRVHLASGRRVGDFLLAEDGRGDLMWVDPEWARSTAAPVLVPRDDGENWEVATVVAWDGRPEGECPF